MNLATYLKDLHAWIPTYITQLLYTYVLVYPLYACACTIKIF